MPAAEFTCARTHATRSRRLSLAIVLVLLAIAASGCSGKTTAATSIGTTTATLNAVASCEYKNQQGCSYRFRYRRVGGGQAITQTPVVGPWNAVATNVELDQSVSGLLPGTQYEYQVCGIGDGLTDWVCVGHDGSSDRWTSFTTVSAPSAATAKTGTATVTGAHAATLRASLTCTYANQKSCSYRFRYRKSWTAESPVPTATFGPIARATTNETVSATVTGLSDGVGYDYQACATVTGSGTWSCDAWKTLKTPINPEVMALNIKSFRGNSSGCNLGNGCDDEASKPAVFLDMARHILVHDPDIVLMSEVGECTGDSERINSRALANLTSVPHDGIVPDPALRSPSVQMADYRCPNGAYRTTALLSRYVSGTGYSFHHGKNSMGGEIGIGIIVRNGYRVGATHDFDLTVPDYSDSQQVAGIAEVIAPTGQRLSAIGIHLAKRTTDDGKPNRLQRMMLTTAIQQIRSTGTAVSSFPDTVVVGGDFNNTHALVSETMPTWMDESFDDLDWAWNDPRRYTSHHSPEDPGPDMIWHTPDTKAVAGDTGAVPMIRWQGSTGVTDHDSIEARLHVSW